MFCSPLLHLPATQVSRAFPQSAAAGGSNDSIIQMVLAVACWKRSSASWCAAILQVPLCKVSNIHARSLPPDTWAVAAPYSLSVHFPARTQIHCEGVCVPLYSYLYGSSCWVHVLVKVCNRQRAEGLTSVAGNHSQHFQIRGVEWTIDTKQMKINETILTLGLIW